MDTAAPSGTAANSSALSGAALGYDTKTGRAVFVLTELSEAERGVLRGLNQAHRRGSATAFRLVTLKRRLGSEYVKPRRGDGGTPAALANVIALGLARPTSGTAPGEVRAVVPEGDADGAEEALDANGEPQHYTLTMPGRKLIRMHRRPPPGHSQPDSTTTTSLVSAGRKGADKGAHAKRRRNSVSSPEGGALATKRARPHAPAATRLSEGDATHPMGLLCAVLSAEHKALLDEDEADGVDARTVADDSIAEGARSTRARRPKAQGEDSVDDRSKAGSPQGSGSSWAQQPAQAAAGPEVTPAAAGGAMTLADVAALEAANAVASFVNARAGSTDKPSEAVAQYHAAMLAMLAQVPPAGSYGGAGAPMGFWGMVPGMAMPMMMQGAYHPQFGGSMTPHGVFYPAGQPVGGTGSSGVAPSQHTPSSAQLRVVD